MLAAVVSTAGGQIACSVNRDIENPAFPVTMDEAKADLDRMRAAPVPLERPVVVLAGYRSWPVLAQGVKWRLFPVTSGNTDDFLPISYSFQSDIEKMARMVVDRVQEQWPSDSDGETIEVDVVGISMGGLVARTAALELGDTPSGEEQRTRRLRVRRLFTMGSPHTGAILAEKIAPDQAAKNMKPGSDFLAHLNDRFESRDYEVVPYAHLNDLWVGATNAAPPGHEPIWTGGTHILSHFSITTDDRIMADLARRLRGEDPVAEPAPAPED